MKNKIIISMLMIPILIGIASACSCIYLEDAKAKIDNAGYVFSGKVIRIETSGSSANEVQEVTIKTNKYWKSLGEEEKETIKLYSSKDTGANCGYNFEEEKEYLIYAYNEIETGKISTNSCMGNSLLSESKDRVNELNQIIDQSSLNSNNENEYNPNIFSKIINWLKSIFS